MNERIQELIVAYLHRGSTPEQERELFEACRDNAEVAELLRQHLVLSLKLRRLRDETEVPAELRNSLLTRINEISAQTPAGVPAPKGGPRFVFGWRHLTGTALAGAALTAAVFFLAQKPAVMPPSASVVTVYDTVVTNHTDTLVTVRTRWREASIARGGMQSDHGALQTSQGVVLADPSGTQVQPATVPSAGVASLPTQLPVDVAENAQRKSADAIDSVIAHTPPALAEARQHEGVTYLEQYTTMVASLEKVRLTSGDRIR